MGVGAAMVRFEFSFFLVSWFAWQGCAGGPAREPVADVADAANAWLESLSVEQRAAATSTLADPARLQWGYVPAQYPGARFGDFDDRARAAFTVLLHTVLADRAVSTVESIVALEDLLRGLETDKGLDARHRDPQRYWVQVFGRPSARGAWAFRVQGHHVSLQFAFADGVLCSATPHFLGTNPHRIPSGPRTGERVLAAEEDLGRALLASLDEAQRAIAVVDPIAPPDVVLGPSRAATEAGACVGLFASAMTESQRAALRRLVEHSVRRLASPFAEKDLERIDAAGFDRVAFSWRGSAEPGKGHYYRVQGPTFVLEYDCTQNDANHVHTLWRDLTRDFGGDVLRAHYEVAHRHALLRHDF